MASSELAPSATETQRMSAGNAAEEIPPFDFRNSPAYAINLLARLLTTQFMQSIAHSGIAPAQGFVLGELWREEPLSQVDLSRRLEIGKATVGQTLLRLERAGLVRRFRIRDDRRVVMIELTEAGRNLREILDQAAWKQLELMRQILGERALRQFATLARKLANALKDHDAAPGSRPSAIPGRC